MKSYRTHRRISFHVPKTVGFTPGEHTVELIDFTKRTVAGEFAVTPTQQAIDTLSAAYLCVQHVRRQLQSGDVLTDVQFGVIGKVEALLADLGAQLAHMHRSELPEWADIALETPPIETSA